GVEYKGGCGSLMMEPFHQHVKQRRLSRSSLACKQNDAFPSLNPVRHTGQRFSRAQGQECIARVGIDPERAFVQTEELFVHTLHSQALSAQTELTSLRRNATAPAVLADGRPIGPRNQRQSGHSKIDRKSVV